MDNAIVKNGDPEPKIIESPYFKSDGDKLSVIDKPQSSVNEPSPKKSVVEKKFTFQVIPYMNSFRTIKEMNATHESQSSLSNLTSAPSVDLDNESMAGTPTPSIPR